MSARASHLWAGKGDQGIKGSLSRRMRDPTLDVARTEPSTLTCNVGHRNPSAPGIGGSGAPSDFCLWDGSLCD